jgi:hypothetical protein
MTKNQKLDNQTKTQTKNVVFGILKEQKPETTQQLIELVQNKTELSHEQITKLLIELENEEKLYFTKKPTPSSTTQKSCIFWLHSAWYWTVAALVMATTVAIFAIPDTAYPIIYLRSALGVIFVLFLPGYAFIKLLFPMKLQRNVAFLTKGIPANEKMDSIERLALSIGMSFGLTLTVGLVLNYTPWGIRLTPITLSLLALSVIFTTAAIIREFQTNRIQFSGTLENS